MLTGSVAGVYFPLSTMQSLASAPKYVNEVLVSVKNASDVAAVTKAIKAELPGATVLTSKSPVPFCQKVLDRGRSFPSVNRASLTETVPIGLIRKGMVTISAAGLAMANSPVSRSARMYVVRYDDFDTAGIGIPRGRDFHQEDEADGATIVSPTEQLVSQYLLKE